MDTDRLANVLRDLRTTPSRRDVGTALVALATSSVLSPFFDHATAGGKGGGGKGGKGKGKGKDKDKDKDKDKKRKKNNPKDLNPPPCALGEIDCRSDPFDCCAPQLCSSTCGCCPATRPSCCGDATSVNRFCYSTADETCCPTTVAKIAGACPKQTFCATGAGGLVPICCPSGSEQCNFYGACCPQGTFCCPHLGCCNNSACDPGIGGVNCSGTIIGQLARTG